MIFTQGRPQPHLTAKRQGVVTRNRQISIVCCCILILLLVGIAIPVRGAEARATQVFKSAAKPTTETANQLRQSLKKKIHVTHAQKASKPATKSIVKPFDATPLPAYNNIGTSDDSNPISGSFDGSNSYSAQALQGVGFIPGQNVTYNNVTFVWPNAASGTPNNYLANGQVIPVTPTISGAVKLAFLGAAHNGSSSGTATITYTDNTTSTFTLNMSDWASATIPGNSIVASMTYLNAATYQRTLTVSVFYTDVTITTGKIVKSVTLPPASASTAGQLHIFAVGVSGPAFNNTGISANASPSGANLDGGGYSYSATALTTAGVTPGTNIPVDGISYPWPTVSTATADNYLAAGQTLPVVPVANATVLGFLGAAHGGASSGTVTITFTDGTTQTSTLGLSDWTLNGGAQTPPSFSNIIASTMTYRNTSTTQQTLTNYLFAAEIALPANKTVQSVTLPTTVSPGALHIFAIGTRSVLNNIGVSDDNDPTTARFDGNGVSGYSYSAQALQSQNIFPGKNVVVNGTVYTWPSAPVGAPDNYIAAGQTIGITPVANATTLGFLGSATGSSTSGTAIVTYTDGTTQTITVALTNWWTSPAAYGNTLAATVPYINAPTGKDTGSFFLYETEVSITAGKTIQSVTLPAASTTAQLHIFAISTRSAYNNTGISDDASPLGANFDGGGRSYSEEDFTDPNTGMGWNPGDTLTYNGMNFIWPNVPADQADNYQAAGQTIPITPVSNANTIGFVGSASNGNSSGTATITYTDGTTQTFTLTMSDWVLGGGSGTPATNNRLFALLTHRNTQIAQNNIYTYLFYSEITLQTGKVVQSVTLPSATATTPGQIHIFSIGTRAGTGYFNNVGTSDDLTTTFANLDAQGDSYSLEALQASSANITQGQSFVFNGVTFQWPTSYSVIPDNYESAGVTISLAPTIPIAPIAGATTLAFVGTAANGNASGTATITYTDNTTSTFTLGFMDWTAGTPTNGNRIVTTMTYYNNAAGQQTRNIYLYEAETTLTVGKTIKSVTLPGTTDHLHVFAVGTK